MEDQVSTPQVSQTESPPFDSAVSTSILQVSVSNFNPWREHVSIHWAHMKVSYCSCNVLVKQTNLLTSILLGDDFFGRHAAKKTGNVDPKMGPKIWTPFWGPRKEKTIRRTPKRGPDFAPHFRVHIAHYFSRSDAGKITFWIECL